MSSYHLPWHTSLIRWVGSPIFRLLFHILSRVEITGKENVPPKGAYIIVFNHISLYDPPLLVAFWPRSPEVLGAVDIWSKAGQDILAFLYHGIPIHRGEVDRNALDLSLAALRAGRPLVVSPEGGRSHKPGMRRAKSGIAYLVEQSQVPIVPVGIVGTTDDFIDQAFHFQRPKVAMRIGAPFQVSTSDDDHLPPKQHRQKVADEIMQSVAALLPENYRGVYGNLP